MESYTQAEREATVRHMEQALLQVQCRKDLRSRLLEKDWDALTDSDFARVMHSGADDQSFVKRGTTDDSGFRSLYFIE